MVMPALRTELYQQAAAVCAALGPLQVTEAVLVAPQPAPDRDAEFGLIALEDGSAGLYYAWLGGAQTRLPEHYRAADLAGLQALDVARRYLGDSDVERSLGLAAISALTAHLHRQAGFVPRISTDSMAELALRTDRRLGMIGYFPPLVRQARAGGFSVAVVERKAHMLRHEPGLEISLDPAVLADCDPIICTGATLLNDSCERMLAYCTGAQRIALVGPTCGFFPDALFARGVDVVAGTRIVDLARASARLAAGRKLGDAAVRTLVTRADYPGFAALLQRALQRL